MRLLDDLHCYFWTNYTQNNCNTYIVGQSTRLVIDPGHRHLFGHVRQAAAKDGLDLDGQAKPAMVLATHSHPDHFEGVELFVNRPGVQIALHPVEAAFLETTGPEFAAMLGMRMPEYRVDVPLAEGDLTVGDLSVQIFHTPGHSPGHVCVYWPERKVLFSGDLVFNQGVGRVDFPGGDGRQLKESIRRMAELDVELLLTGHGEPVQGRAEVARNFKYVEQAYFGWI